jgi:hypothetical protein
VNTLTNTWKYAKRGGSRHVAVTIESTRPLGDDEYELMRQMTALAEAYTGDTSAQRAADGDGQA